MTRSEWRDSEMRLRRGGSESGGRCSVYGECQRCKGPSKRKRRMKGERESVCERERGREGEKKIWGWSSSVCSVVSLAGVQVTCKVGVRCVHGCKPFGGVDVIS
jgi:hypothetical protein